MLSKPREWCCGAGQERQCVLCCSSLVKEIKEYFVARTQVVICTRQVLVRLGLNELGVLVCSAAHGVWERDVLVKENCGGVRKILGGNHARSPEESHRDRHGVALRKDTAILCARGALRTPTNRTS